VIISNDRKRRGRPKKLIFDSSLNEYIDSSHPNFKQLNKELKNLERIQMLTHILDADESFESENPGNNDSIAKLHHQPTYLRKLDDDAVKQLMQKKDRRGRPRKFPVEQTGLTIKGIRVNGNRKKKGE
jgi:predicted type IV restriction endonuclease